MHCNFHVYKVYNRVFRRPTKKVSPLLYEFGTVKIFLLFQNLRQTLNYSRSVYNETKRRINLEDRKKMLLYFS